MKHHVGLGNNIFNSIRVVVTVESSEKGKRKLNFLLTFTHKGIKVQGVRYKKFHEEKQFLFLHIKIPLISRKEKLNCATVAMHRHNEEATIGMEIHHSDAYNVFL